LLLPAGHFGNAVGVESRRRIASMRADHPFPFLRALGPALLLLGCDALGDNTPALSRSSGELQPGHQVPNLSEAEAIGAATTRISRLRPEFRQLVRNTNADIVFKDEETTGADRLMTRRLSERLNRLSRLVEKEWRDDVHLRVTDAWDEQREHGPHSAHYEGRAVDLTTSDLDSTKLGRLGFLAVQAGFDWVYFENRAHIHASVRR
jgi:Hedgehog amino-terminal signalling domain